MAHSITLRLEHGIEIKNVDATFEIRQDDELMGYVKISKGGIDWKPAGAHAPIKRRWHRFARWMEEG